MSGRASARAILVLVALLVSGCSTPPTPQSTPAASPHSAAASPSAAPPTATAPAIATPTPRPSTATPQAPAPPGVIVLMLENHSYSDVIGSSSAPALNNLAQRYGLATQSYGMDHPSLPNYISLITGSSYGIRSDCTDCNIDGTTIADQMVSSGHDWAAYMEDMPSPCWNGATVDNIYGKKHNPFMYFDHIRSDAAACAKDQPFSNFYSALDGGRLPAYSMVSPNICHDGHSCALRDSDTWVGGFAAHVIGSAWFQHGGVLIITYDEGVGSDGCCQTAAGGHIPTWVISTRTPAGARLNTPVDHAGVLRTIEALYGLSFLGDARCACSGDLLPLLGR